jgi:hypothetical protein
VNANTSAISTLATNKADKTEHTAGLGTKSSYGELTAALNLKANTSALTSLINSIGTVSSLFYPTVVQAINANLTTVNNNFNEISTWLTG